MPRAFLHRADALRQFTPPVTSNIDGVAEFKCPPGKVSVWVSA